MPRTLVEYGFFVKDPRKLKFEKVLVDKKYLSYFQILNMGSCLSSSSRCSSPLSPSNLSLPSSLPSYVILKKVGKKEKRSQRMEVDWYMTRVFVKKMPTIEEKEIPIS